MLSLDHIEELPASKAEKQQISAHATIYMNVNWIEGYIKETIVHYAEIQHI